MHFKVIDGQNNKSRFNILNEQNQKEGILIITPGNYRFETGGITINSSSLEKGLAEFEEKLKAVYLEMAVQTAVSGSKIEAIRIYRAHVEKVSIEKARSVIEEQMKSAI